MVNQKVIRCSQQASEVVRIDPRADFAQVDPEHVNERVRFAGVFRSGAAADEAVDQRRRHALFAQGLVIYRAGVELCRAMRQLAAPGFRQPEARLDEVAGTGRERPGQLALRETQHGNGSAGVYVNDREEFAKSVGTRVNSHRLPLRSFDAARGRSKTSSSAPSPCSMRRGFVAIQV